MADSGEFSDSRVMNLLPIMTPEALSQAMRNVSWLLIPKPTMRGLCKDLALTCTEINGKNVFLLRFK